MAKRALLAAVVVLVTAIGTWSQAPDDAYHAAPPKAGAKLAPILAKGQLWFAQDESVRRAYEVAAQNDKVLYQLPCHCHCSRNMGHTSLRSCFEGTHAAGCDVCMKEALYAGEQTGKGKTPAQIRAGIARSEYQKIDLQTGSSRP